jgi:hypothetical protein
MWHQDPPRDIHGCLIALRRMRRGWRLVREVVLLRGWFGWGGWTLDDGGGTWEQTMCGRCGGTGRGHATHERENWKSLYMTTRGRTKVFFCFLVWEWFVLVDPSLIWGGARFALLEIHPSVQHFRERNTLLQYFLYTFLCTLLVPELVNWKHFTSVQGRVTHTLKIARIILKYTLHANQILEPPVAHITVSRFPRLNTTNVPLTRFNLCERKWTRGRSHRCGHQITNIDPCTHTPIDR